MKNKINHLFFAAVALVLLCSCEPNSPQTLTETLPETEVVLTPTELSRPTGTSTEAEPSLTTTTPVVPLSQEGPWLVIHSDEGAWVANADGTGLAQIANSNDYGGLFKLGISPHGGRLAFFYPPFAPPEFVADKSELFLVEFPLLTSTALTRLYSSTSSAATASTDHPYELEETIYSALVGWNELSWSPDGETLAFAGAQDGPSVDLYMYSVSKKTISRLTDGPTQTISINWSPDGQYIVSGGAERMNAFAGGSNGPELAAIWVVKPDGSDLHSIYTYASDEQGPPVLIGWVNNRAYLENYIALGCGRYGFTFVDIQTPTQYTIIPGIFTSLALDPVTGTSLVLIPKITDENSYMRDCGSTHEPGLYLMSVYDSENLKRIPFDIPSTQDDELFSISWSPEANLFFIFTGLNVYTVDLQGQVTLANLPNTYHCCLKPSPDGREWAGYGDTGLWIASEDHPRIKITSNGVSDFLWTPDGSTLLFMSEDMLYRAAAPDYQPVLVAGPIARWSSREWQIDWVMP